MSKNAISANPEHYIFKTFRGSMPRTPLEGLKKIFVAAAWLKNFFQDRLPPKQKIPDRTLNVARKSPSLHHSISLTNSLVFIPRHESASSNRILAVKSQNITLAIFTSGYCLKTMRAKLYVETSVHFINIWVVNV